MLVEKVVSVLLEISIVLEARLDGIVLLSIEDMLEIDENEKVVERIVLLEASVGNEVDSTVETLDELDGDSDEDELVGTELLEKNELERLEELLSGILLEVVALITELLEKTALELLEAKLLERVELLRTDDVVGITELVENIELVSMMELVVGAVELLEMKRLELETIELVKTDEVVATTELVETKELVVMIELVVTTMELLETTELVSTELVEAVEPLLELVAELLGTTELLTMLLKVAEVLTKLLEADELATMLLLLEIAVPTKELLETIEVLLANVLNALLVEESETVIDTAEDAVDDSVEEADTTVVDVRETEELPPEETEMVLADGSDATEETVDEMLPVDKLIDANEEELVREL